MCDKLWTWGIGFQKQAMIGHEGYFYTSCVYDIHSLHRLMGARIKRPHRKHYVTHAIRFWEQGTQKRCQNLAPLHWLHAIEKLLNVLLSLMRHRRAIMYLLSVKCSTSFKLNWTVYTTKTKKKSFSWHHRTRPVAFILRMLLSV